MKHLINRFKKTAIVFALLLLVISVALATSFYTVIVATELQMKSGSALNMVSTSRQFFDGSSYLAMGDSAYLSVGRLVADTGSFATPTGLFTKAVYVPGATASDVGFATKRVVLGVSTAAPTASDTAHLSVMMKTDSAIVLRTDTTISGLKFNLFHLKLR